MESEPDAALQKFIDEHLKIVEPLTRKAALANWELQTTSSAEARERCTKLTSQLARVYASRDEFAFLQNLSPGSVHDPLLARQLTLLRNQYLASQIDENTLDEIIALEIEIEDRFNTYRAVVRGKSVTENEIQATLLESQDESLRRETWEASKTVGEELAESVLHLVRLRNREAKRLGFSDFYAMSLELQEQNEVELFSLLEQLRRQSDPLWKVYKAGLDRTLAERFQLTPDAVRPWHHANPFFQETGPGEADLDRFFADKDLEALTADFFRAIGLPIEDLLLRADLYEREGKCQHAFCQDIDRKGDVRVLCNNRPNERWMETMLHEFGHAIYDKYHDPELPYILREPAHTMTTEAIALFMGRLSKDPNWLIRYAGVPPDEAERIGNAARRQVRDHLLVFMRWCFVMVHFERALYRDPDQDLNTLWWDLVEEYQNLIRPEGRNMPDWAAKTHIATSPVYYHNYLLGEMVASQLLNYINSVVLADEPADALVASPKVGAYLVERLFRPGATRPWNAWLEHATGESLNPNHFVQQLA